MRSSTLRVEGSSTESKASSQRRHVSAEKPWPAGALSSQTREPVGFTMRNVRLHAAGDVVLDVAMLDGHLVTTHGDLPVFDDQQSFYVNVDHAEISANAASVTGLVRQAFAYKDAPIKNVRRSKSCASELEVNL